MSATLASSRLSLATRLSRAWWAKPLAILAMLVPLALLVSQLLTGGLGANPIVAFERSVGNWALRLLLLGLAITPLRRLTGIAWPLRFRRWIGIVTFAYALVHLAAYFLDQGFDWPSIWADVLKRPYITIGVFALLILTALAVTSNDWSVRTMRAGWRRLHRLVYLAALAGVVHYIMLVKSWPAEPLIYAAILALLLGYRLVSGGARPGVAARPVAAAARG